jgi:putative NADPH-quinone reductase
MVIELTEWKLQMPPYWMKVPLLLKQWHYF